MAAKKDETTTPTTSWVRTKFKITSAENKKLQEKMAKASKDTGFDVTRDQMVQKLLKDALK